MADWIQQAVGPGSRRPLAAFVVVIQNVEKGLMDVEMGR